MMLNRFVLVGHFKERNIINDEKENWIVEIVDSVINDDNTENKYDVEITLNFRNDDFDKLKKGNVVGIRGKVISQDNRTILIADKITILTKGVE